MGVATTSWDPTGAGISANPGWVASQHSQSKIGSLLCVKEINLLYLDLSIASLAKRGVWQHITCNQSYGTLNAFTILL